MLPKNIMRKPTLMYSNPKANETFKSMKVMEDLKERSELKLEVLSHIIFSTIRGSKEGKGQHANESATRGGRKCRCGSFEHRRYKGENHM